MSANLTISRLAAAGSVNVETVRYYQRRGLLVEPERPLGGVRRYGQTEVARLQFIRRAKLMGFSLDEVQQLLLVNEDRACEMTRDLASKKLVDVRRRLADLQHFAAELEHLVQGCCEVPAGDPCPALQLLVRCEE